MPSARTQKTPWSPVTTAEKSWRPSAPGTGALPLGSAQEVAKQCDLLLLAVKPMIMPEILREIAPVVTKDQIIVSIAVGLTIDSYLAVLGQDKKVVRAMPNTPAAVQAGMTAFTFCGNVTVEEQDAVLKLFSLAGGTSVLPERLMNAVSALTGSSPAYVYMFIEAMADAGCYAGIPRQQAYELAAQAVLGLAKNGAGVREASRPAQGRSLLSRRHHHSCRGAAGKVRHAQCGNRGHPFLCGCGRKITMCAAEAVSKCK